MSSYPMSLRRRHLIMAGMVGIATPVSAFCEQYRDGPSVAGRTGDTAVTEGERLVLSGRIVHRDSGHAAAGARLEIWQPAGCAHCASAIADADGRFVLTVESREASRISLRTLRYRVSHDGMQSTLLPLRERIGQIVRDADGAWRAAVGVALA